MLRQNREIGGNGKVDGGGEKEKEKERDAGLDLYWRVNGQGKNMEAFLIDDKIALIRSYKLLCQ